MIIKMSSDFRNNLHEYFTEDSLTELIVRLIGCPTSRAVVRGLGGIRKVRAPDRINRTGARSGLRILYAYRPDESLLVLYLAYRKSDQSDILPHQRVYLITFSDNDFEDDATWQNPQNN